MLQELVYDQRIWTAAAVAAVVLLILVTIGVRRRRTRHERQVKKQVKQLAVRSMRQVFIDDGVEGEIFVDYLFHTDRLIVVLNVQNYPGKIYGGDKVEMWTQVFGNRSYKFANPQGYLQSCVASVKSLVPGVPVVGRVVFTMAGEFPKGIPSHVVTGESLVKEIRSIEAGMAPMERTGINMAWDKLQAALHDKTNPQVHLSKREAAL